MHLSKLSLLNFKNCLEVSFNFSDRVNCFLGNNGQGKTNILDAIHYLSYTKSYFNSIDSQNISFNHPFFVIQGEFMLENELQDLYCGMKRGEKKIFRKNKKTYSRLADHIGFLSVVMITPYDSNLVLDGSDIRRKFIDALISQINREYLENLIFYNKILIQRNTLLKKWAENGVFQKDLLDIIDVQLIDKAKFIHSIRAQFLKSFIPEFNEYYKKIAQVDEHVELVYESSLNNEMMEDLLKTNLNKDRKLKYTSDGIHRDDLLFKINDFPLKKYGSQGQQKSFLIALKLAKFNFIREKKGFTPILLLDDIFDKLDHNRVNYIVDLIEKEKLGQTFITDTDIKKVPGILKAMKVDFKAFEIQQGSSKEL